MGKKKISKLFGQSAYDQAPAVNYEGAPAFVRTPEERLIQVLTTGTFEPAFYASAHDLAAEAVELFKEFAQRDPRFLAQATIYAREAGLMRLAPITALVVLSTAADKRFFHAAFRRVIRTPGDAQDFLRLVRAGSIRKYGRAVRTAMKAYLADLSEYHVIKYGSEKQDLSLRDSYRLNHPKLTGKANAIARYVVKGEATGEAPQIAGYEAFKAAAAAYRSEPGDLQAVLDLVTEHKLPWEVVAGQVPATTEAWVAMLSQMPYMALLKNLNNLLKYGVCERSECLDYICQTLADPERVRSSKQFPFAFYSASKALQVAGAGSSTAHLRLKSALEQALDAAYTNMPDIGNRVLIANDVSGSMHGKVSQKSSLTIMEVASVFAAAAYKKAEAGEVVSFDTALYKRSALKKSMPTLAIAQMLNGAGGGTDLSLPLRYLLSQRGKRYDTAILITDNQSWVDHLTRHRGILDEIRAYRRHVPGFTVFFWQVLPYQHASAPPEEPGCYYVYGWSDSVLAFIGAMSQGGGNQVEAVRAISLPE